MPQSKDFKVAIVGGGMCGLMCAVGLRRAGIAVEIFESTISFQEIGAGIGLGPNALRALKSLGLLDSLIARQSERGALSSFQFRSGLAGREFTYDYPCASDDVGITIHRYSMSFCLDQYWFTNITGLHFILKRCVSVSANTESSIYTIGFADGTSHEADLIIGADGIKSTVRESVIKSDHLYPVYTGTTAYRSLIKRESLNKAGFKTHLERPICFLGAHKYLITYPIKAGELINVVVYVTDAKEEEDLVSQFQEWNEDVKAIIHCIDQTSKWPLYELNPPLRTYISGRVALVGDAAHAMLPHLGAGVGQGIEDTYILCELLGNPQTKLSNLEDVIKAYDHVRIPRATDVSDRSRHAGLVCQRHGLPEWTDEDTLTGLTNRWAPLWYHDLEADKTEALKWLEKAGIFIPISELAT
ncbi:FAD/NAD-P-binding domain-containing protein [Gymnopus androsaceus JB14]|uniref:FAD/NAD-P-binding domain-containing protein n=1 Tax=Gymnopus androsaceus JB14 TaxID=1447944 RepID=A0A6A4HY36_9AGAR|nr:FAD/NAD-P-binding domain-containing protein [Gymnopus androsaceus JB14]